LSCYGLSLVPRDAIRLPHIAIIKVLWNPGKELTNLIYPLLRKMPESLAEGHEATNSQLDEDEVADLSNGLELELELDSGVLYGSSVFDTSAMSPLSPASAVSQSICHTMMLFHSIQSL
jgi:hypothetical protein